MSRLTKAILIIGIAIVIYSYLCRELNIYFFWDSKMIGLILLFVALLSYWVDLRRIRRHRRKKIVWVTIGICFIVFGFVSFFITLFMLKSSDAYGAATEFLKSDSNIKAELGEVNGFGLIPIGAFVSSTMNGRETGSATFEITIHANKKNKDVKIHLEKTADKAWTVTDVR
jgi:hypothetical protein